MITFKVETLVMVRRRTLFKQLMSISGLKKLDQTSKSQNREIFCPGI